MGLIGVFATFANAFYHYYLSELINSLSKVFNPKDLSHLKYHIYAIIFGLISSLISIIIEDIGITVSYEIIIIVTNDKNNILVIWFSHKLIWIVFWKLWHSKRIFTRILIQLYLNFCMAFLCLVSNQMFHKNKKKSENFERLGKILFKLNWSFRNNFTSAT